jgi:CRP/FNR family cyclic AMP-dependent transcriptional regulator
MDFAAEHQRTYAAGEVVFAEGTVGKHMYVVQSGTVEIRTAVAGADQTVATLKVGEMLGEMALLDDAPRSATAVAGREGARLLEVDHALFIYLVGQQPAFALMVMQSLARRLRANLHPGAVVA